MSLNFKQLKSADKEFRYAVFGFLRLYETTKSINIPTMVKYVCLNYYLLCEKFTKYGSNIKLNKSKDTIQPIEPGHINTVYGDNMINSLDESIIEYKWQFQIRGTMDLFGIGIDSSKKRWLNGDFTDNAFNTSKYYSWIFDIEGGEILLHDSEYKRPKGLAAFDEVRDVAIFNPSNTDYCKCDHNMILIMDMKDRTLRFQFDDREIEPHKDINFDTIHPYNLAIYMFGYKHKITLTKFSIKNDN